MQSTPSTPMASQAFKPGVCTGHSHSVGKINASAAPHWLPVAVTSGGMPVRKRLVKLAAMP